MSQEGEETMTEEDKPKVNVMGGPGITSTGDVTFGNNSGQIAVGSNINQSQFQSINQTGYSCPTPEKVK